MKKVISIILISATLLSSGICEEPILGIGIPETVTPSTREERMVSYNRTEEQERNMKIFAYTFLTMYVVALARGNTFADVK